VWVRAGVGFSLFKKEKLRRVYFINKKKNPNREYFLVVVVVD
jgi:hypothetical protein